MLKAKFITGLDIGSENIKILVVEERKGDSEPEVLKYFRFPSEGIRKGTIINVEQASNSLRSALEEFQNSFEQKINSAIVNISGSHIFSTPSRGVIAVSRADQKISPEDIDRVLQAAQTFSLPSNKEVLDTIVKEFIIDGEKGIKEPLGMKGIRLEAEILALCGFSPYIKNLTDTVLNAGLQIQDIFVSPLASSRAVLTPRQKELGVVLLDIGAGTTSLAVFEEGDLIQASIFPIGSGHITNDIAIGLRCDIDTAERIKLEYGSCFLHSGKKKEKIKNIHKEEPLVFSLKMLGKIIEARISEIFDLTNKELKKIARQGKLPAGVVLTGGGAKLPKIGEMAKKELKLSCKIGYPKGIAGLEQDPSFALVAGLVLSGLDSEQEQPVFGEKFTTKIKKIFKIFIP
ncbi:MAG TPA: cell division protein FtsA [Candidatus Nealsonbacteria bacterium]|uniref:SHS2 domain-containing protein n=1 Tax=marine sediment metagenome TaxID=412755 RepID=A0A0F9UP99_9ZZZZ|nr:cell division protein FtsA [Candidatus Nealsonbacteria bacterium]HEB46449.1 cell division protein FtsA [Candidatus Nealsonbacteria bacterium]